MFAGFCPLGLTVLKLKACVRRTSRNTRHFCKCREITLVNGGEEDQYPARGTLISCRIFAEISSIERDVDSI